MARGTIHNSKGYISTPRAWMSVLRQTVGQSLVSWTIVPEAKTAYEIPKREALRAKYLEPLVTTQILYKARLVQPLRGIPMPLIKGVSILLTEGDFDFDEDNTFVCWGHKPRRLSSMINLTARVSFADVSLEHKFARSFRKGQIPIALVVQIALCPS